MRLVGANHRLRIVGREKSTGMVNYFVGDDPTKWQINVPSYAAVHYHDLYPGIDLVYYGNQRELEYDFIVRPGADPKRIALRVQGAHRLELDARGDLLIHTSTGSFRHRKPLLHQEVDGVRRAISGGYMVTGANQFGFQVAEYDRRLPLIIDPVLVYSTYLGGSGYDSAQSIAVDTAGNAYVTGFTASLDFPVLPGAAEPAAGGGFDVFVTKVNSLGNGFVYSTYLGGRGDDCGLGIAVDAGGNAYVTGRTTSANFPTTRGVFQSTFGGTGDAFVTKLNPTGSALVYSTYLGGGAEDFGAGIAVDVLGNAYVAGVSASLNFPTTPGAVQVAYGGGPTDAFVTKLNSTGTALLYSTYLGGSDVEHVGGIAADAVGNAYVIGDGASPDFPTTSSAFQVKPAAGGALFVTKLDPTGSSLVYSTHLGGTNTQFSGGIAVDATGHAYVTGHTRSVDFPTTAGAFQPTFGGTPPFGDAFVTKLNPSGSGLVYSTYLGGSGDDHGFGIAVDVAGNAYLTGFTGSPNFPTTTGTLQSVLHGAFDAFVTILNSTGTALAFSTYLGGGDFENGLGIAVDAVGDVYVTGFTGSLDFPTTPGAPVPNHTGRDTSMGFVAKITQRRP